MSAADLPANQLLKFRGGKIALTPELWLALGVASYNHRILAQAPLPIVDPKEVVADLSEEELEAIAQGLAAITDATALAPSALDATLRITRSLLAPLHVTAKVIGAPSQTQVYLMLQFQPEAAAKRPRILPAHSYPASHADDPGTGEHRKQQQEAEIEGIEPESTGQRRSGGTR